jgi:2',3'-cyclic-nucleotide 2'-phosphodiesterase (5'-nucleotidase family)
VARVASWLFAAVVASAGAHAQPASAVPKRADGVVTLMHIGDIHGHLVSRPDALGTDRRAGGIARIAAVVERIRRERGGRALLVNVGDALQGSAEALFTRGQAVVDVLAPLRIDAFIPGNWDFTYGIDRFVETFVGARGRRPLAPWPTIASNLYYATPAAMGSPYAHLAGERVLPAFIVREVDGVRVAIIGITTTRGLRGMGTAQTRGLTFSPGEGELAHLVTRVRGRERADVVVVASELELANNVRLAEETPGIDVILSADMHELTREPVVASTGTVIVEEGQDGAAVGEITLTVRDGRVAGWQWRLHEITDSLPEDTRVARAVAAARQSFLAGAAFNPNLRNPLNGALLVAPIDQVVGYTAVPLHRANPADQAMPAVMEGSSHDFLSDAIRAAAGADVALIRGFRYGTQVRPGPITRADLYHYLPIGGQVAVADSVPGRVLWHYLEASLEGTLAPDPRLWTGGWFVGTSGLALEVDPYRADGARLRSVLVNGAPLDTTAGQWYSVAGLWFPSEPDAVTNCTECVGAGGRVRLVKAPRSGSPDAVEIVAAYLASLPDSTVSPVVGRVRLVRPLPPHLYRFDELQPLHGASEPVTLPHRTGQTPPSARH